MRAALIPVLIAVFLSAISIVPSAPAQDEPIRTDQGLVYPEGARIPASMTDAEYTWLAEHPRQSQFSRSAPTGSVYCVPEYEPMAGLLIAWESYTDVLEDLTVGITTGDPSATVWVVVDSSSEQSSAYSALAGSGAIMSQVEFVVRTTDTVWIRDYGPRYVYEDGIRAIIDHTYNRVRPNDNALNDYLATLWGQAQYDIPLTHGGGNFHLFANGDAFMSSLILAENPGLSEQDVKDLYQQYQNLDLTIYTGFPTSFDSTRHIDMWMLPVDDYEIIIGEYASSTGQPYTITENAVADLTSRGYTVYRTPGWNSGGTHYTYTNAVVLNDQVFVPRFGGSYTSQDAQALAVFETAFADHNVSQIYCGSIIHAAGAIHCIVMHVPVESTGMLVTPGDDLTATGPAGGPFAPGGIVYSVQNNGDGAIDYEVTKTVSWLTITNDVGSIPAHSSVDVTVALNANVNSLGHGLHEDTITFTNLTDHEGDTQRNVSVDVDATAKQYVFNMDSDPGWSTQGLWDFGVPTGGGSHAGDPDSGYTGDNVYGYNLFGDYPSNMGQEYLTTTAIDCTDLIELELRFWRWLGVERDPYDFARIEISNDGLGWAELWSNPTSSISDSSWTQMAFDISAVADDEPTVYIRWCMGTTDDGTTYPGWNIDDIEIWGVNASPPCPGDLNGDGSVNLSDLAQLLAAYGTCDGAPGYDAAADIDGDNCVTITDLATLLSVYGTACP